MSKSRAFILCNRKSTKQFLVGVSRSNIKEKNVVLEMNCHSAEIQVKRPEILPRFTAPELSQKMTPKENQNEHRTKKNGETKTRRKQTNKQTNQQTNKQTNKQAGLKAHFQITVFGRSKPSHV